MNFSEFIIPAKDGILSVISHVMSVFSGESASCNVNSFSCSGSFIFYIFLMISIAAIVYFERSKMLSAGERQVYLEPPKYVWPPFWAIWFLAVLIGFTVLVPMYNSYIGPLLEIDLSASICLAALGITVSSYFVLDSNGFARRQAWHGSARWSSIQILYISMQETAGEKVIFHFKSDQDLARFSELYKVLSYPDRARFIAIRPWFAARYHEAMGNLPVTNLFSRLIIGAWMPVLFGLFIIALISKFTGGIIDSLLIIVALFNILIDLFIPLLSLVYGPMFLLNEGIVSNGSSVPVGLYCQVCAAGFIASIYTRGIGSGYIALSFLAAYGIGHATFIAHYYLDPSANFFIDVASALDSSAIEHPFGRYILEYSAMGPARRELYSLSKDIFLYISLPGFALYIYALSAIHNEITNTPAGRITYFNQIEIQPLARVDATPPNASLEPHQKPIPPISAPVVLPGR